VLSVTYKTFMLSVTMLKVIMLRVMGLSFMPSVTYAEGRKLAFMVSVIMMSVVAPFRLPRIITGVMRSF
jgi:hypothetical protein